MKKGTIAVLSAMLGGITGLVGSKYLKKNPTEKLDKFRSYYYMLNQWMILKYEGKSLEQYFVERGYKTIAIYGMGEMGLRLYSELKDSCIEVKYAVDKNGGYTYSDIIVYELEDELEEVDVIVVSAIFAFKEVEKELGKKIDVPIISLEDVIYKD